MAYDFRLHVTEPATSQSLSKPRLAIELRQPWLRLLLGINELVTHVVGVLVILGSIGLVEYAMHKAWPNHELILFDGLGVFQCKVAWLFDAAEVGIIIVFSWQSVITFKKALAK